MNEVETEEHLALDTVDLGRVGRFAGQVNLDSISTVWSHAERTLLGAGVDDEWGSTALLGYDGHPAEIPGGLLCAHVMLFAHWDNSWVDGPPESGPADDDDVRIAALYELTYELLEGADVDDEDFRHFAFYKATFNAWPYWRAHVQHAVAELGLPRMTVPVFRVRKS